MADPLNGDQTRRGQYVGPTHPLMNAVAVTVAVVFCILILLGLDAVVAWFINLIFFSHHHFHMAYVLSIIGTLALLLLVHHLDTGLHADE